jgi:hypothetical protein
MNDRIVLTDDLLLRTLQARAANDASVERLADDIAREVVRTAQDLSRREFRLGWRTRALAATSIAVVAILAFVLVGPMTGPVIREIKLGAEGTIGPLLEAGRYRSSAFSPAVEFTVPDRDWAPAVDLPTELQLLAVRPGQPSDQSGSVTVLRLDSVMSGGCGYDGSTPWITGQGDPQAFITWLNGQLPGNLRAPEPVTIDGRAGLQVKLQPSQELKQECDFGFVLTDVGTAASPRRVEIAIDGRRVRIAAVVVSGKLVVVMTAGAWTSQYPDITADADGLIASMTFR